MRQHRAWRQTRRIGTAVATTGMLLAGGGIASATAATAVPHSAKPRSSSVTITFWDDNGGPRTPIYMHLIPMFEKENPGIKVKYVGIPDPSVLEKYDTAIAGGDPPDIGAIPGGDLAAIVAQSALVPLNKLYQSSPLNGKLLPTLLTATAASSSNDKTLWALPFSGVPSTLWCNMVLFRAKHLTCPTTWNAFFTDAKALTNSSKGQYGLTMRGAGGSTNQLTDEMVSYAGLTSYFTKNGKSTFDSPRAVDFIKRFAAIEGVDTPNDVDNGYLQMVAEFDSKKIGMMLHNLGSYASNVSALGGASNVVGLTEPQGPYNKPGVLNMVAPGLDTYGIFKASKNQAADWKFEEFLLSAQANGYWNQQVGQLPGNSDVLKQAWVAKQQPIKSMLAALANPKTVVVPAPNYLPQLGTIVTNMDTLWQEVLTKQITPQQWCSTYASQLTSAEYLWTHGHR